VEKKKKNIEFQPSTNSWGDLEQCDAEPASKQPVTTRNKESQAIV